MFERLEGERCQDGPGDPYLFWASRALRSPSYDPRHGDTKIANGCVS